MRGAHAGDVFTISLHQHNNYPMFKPPSSIDVDLPDGTGDDDYLAWLDNALSSGLRQFEPDLMCYIAGADPYREDQLGGLDLSIEGLKNRDELVFRVARARDIPVMVTFAGGYARNVEDTVTIHSNTVAAAARYFPKRVPTCARCYAMFYWWNGFGPIGTASPCPLCLRGNDHATILCMPAREFPIESAVLAVLPSGANDRQVAVFQRQEEQ